MRRIVRNGTFETNSSSSHSISIYNKEKDGLVEPKKMLFFIHEFHSHPETDMSSIVGRCSYLYSAAINHNMEDELKETLKEVFPNTKLKFQEFQEDMSGEENYYESRYLINHQCQEDAYDFLKAVLNDHVLLKNYILDDDTVVNIRGDWDDLGVKKDDDHTCFGWIKTGDYEYEEDN